MQPTPVPSGQISAGASEGLHLTILFLDMGSHAIERTRSAETSVTVHTSYDRRFRDIIRLEPPDWLVLDDFLEDQQVRDTLLHVRRQPRPVSVLLLGPSDDYGRCECWIRVGVRCYLASTAGSGRILESVRMAHQYDIVVTDACFQRPQLDFARRLAPVEAFTKRELEILSLARNGYRSEEMAALLHLTLHTVEFHFRNVNAKLGTRSRTQAVARAIFLGLISSSEISKASEIRP